MVSAYLVALYNFRALWEREREQALVEMGSGINTVK